MFLNVIRGHFIDLMHFWILIFCVTFLNMTFILFFSLTYVQFSTNLVNKGAI